ncbi:hypothetical protein DPMN_157799 [Dreissena polymorpha]|uniref:Uncharacterized protein n=1 Tax=Dreissena polymorpha TaxID=45954 RepID=A0A9D4IML3_DREPO|nr:hypothetical protein DPMN_157799 [Dreissena polymorpha]
MFMYITVAQWLVYDIAPSFSEFIIFSALIGVRLVREGKLRRHQNKQTLQVQGKLWGVWKRYNERSISTSQLLDLCSAMYGPVMSVEPNPEAPLPPNEEQTC